MSEIFPFKGLLYNVNKVKNLSGVVTPPYDVIAPSQTEYFYNLNEFNIIRLILPKGNSDKYKIAAETLNNWITKRILIRDEEPCIYAVKEEFVFKGIKKERTGFISLVRLEDFEKGSVLPHEGTLHHPKKDRSELIKACRANLCPIFGMYIDIEKKIDKTLKNEIHSSLPDMQFSTDILHKMWRIKNTEVINNIVAEMKNKKILIADGHHRYEASLSLKDTYGFVMMQLFNLEDDGIIILPTHRLLRNLSDSAIKEIEKNIEKNFIIKESNRETIFNEMENIGREKRVFGAYCKAKGFRLFISLNTTDELGVNTIHNRLLHNMDVSYTIDAEDAISKVEKGEINYVFFLNPTKIKEVENEANRGRKMPGKSTYFYPKLITGLVINKWNL